MYSTDFLYVQEKFLCKVILTTVRRFGAGKFLKQVSDAHDTKDVFIWSKIQLNNSNIVKYYFK